MEYRTVTGVELVTVGMDWPASSGNETFTFEDLADAEEAANNDPHVLAARIKLGHESLVNGELRVIDPFEAVGDAAPAFGRIVNLRRINDGAVLIGDYIEVPAWLAEAIPSAYPNRSIEARRLVETEGGKRYGMVLTAVALLGPVLPACSELEDIERFLIEGPSGVAAAANPEEGRMTETAALSVDTATIKQRFNFDWAMSDPVDGLDTYWWWARSVRVDPAEIVADDDEGGCWSVPFETDGKDEVTFGEPVKVREEFVPVEATATSVVANFRERKDQRVLASNLERPEKPAPQTAASSQPDNEEDTMDAKAIRESLGLAEDATDEEVIAKGQELREAAEAEVEKTTEEETEETTETPEETAVAASLGTTVDKEALAQLLADAKAGREALAAQLSAERKDIVDAALKVGKFPPSAAAAYREQLDKGDEIEASTRAFIDGLPENTVPVVEIGVATEDDSAGLDRVMASFPGHKSKQAA